MRLQYLTIEERERLRQEDPEEYARLAGEFLPSQTSPMVRKIKQNQGQPSKSQG
jgi:hypothetical protein